MVGFLRIIGILNASVWFGAMIFFTVGVGPAFFSEEMTRLLSRPYAGSAAQIVLERYFLLQIWCAAIALAHLIAEWLYTGRPFQRFILLLLMTLFIVSMIGHNVFLPRMKELHLKRYAQQTTLEVKMAAERSFKLLHGVSMVINLLVISGVLVYVWQVTKPVISTRFSSGNRFKT